MSVIEAPERVVLVERDEQQTPEWLLERAAEIIETKGWTREHLFNRGRYCVLGAIYSACGTPDEILAFDEMWDGSQQQQRELGREAKQKFEEVVGTSPITFNDEVARSGKEVARKLREAAAR